MKFKKKSKDGSTKFSRKRFFCGKKGHRQSDCRFKKKKDENNSNKANVIKNQFEEIYATVSEVQIGVMIELNIVTATKSSDWWLDSGAIIHAMMKYYSLHM